MQAVHYFYIHLLPDDTRLFSTLFYDNVVGKSMCLRILMLYVHVYITELKLIKKKYKN